ncbi:MAG: acyltransferase [Sphingomonadales bacterium]|nr:acyltransferase [Sphingomonadales bacterium]
MAELVLARAVETSPRAKGRGAEFNAAAHGLRGIASLMVFCAHILGGTAEHIYAENLEYVALIYRPWQFGRWGVELFFVISGFVILPSVLRYAPKEFALRRFFRIYPLFFVLSLLFVGLNLITNTQPAMNNPWNILACLLFLNLATGTDQLTPNAWSLTFEVIFYTLTAFIVYFLKHKRSEAWAAGAIVTAIVFVALYPIAVFFLFGIGIRLLFDRGLIPTGRGAQLAEIGFAIGCLIFASTDWFHYTPADLANPLVYAIIISTVGYFCLAVSPQSLTSRLLSGRAITYLGTVSYSLYLVHPYTYLILRMLFQDFGLFDFGWQISMPLFFLVAVPITLIATHLAHHALERFPYQWFFHQRIYRVRPTSKA